jgi:C4-dicarboxylate transporter DctM subunit
MELIAMLTSLCILMVLGIPIAVSLGASAILTLLAFEDISLIVFPQKLFVGSDSFPLMAIIFFMIAGELMVYGGISKRLLKVAKYFLNRLRGSLAYTSIVTCAFFGALSGSALATTAAIGKIMYPEMVNDGTYDKDFALIVQAVGGTLGTMIPPSIPLVIYAMLTNTSIASLFLGIIVPGIVVCFLYCITAYFLIKKRGMATKDYKDEKIKANDLLDALWALLTPAIILGGIYSGIFSPTESAAVACGYAFIIGKFVYKELNNKKIYEALYNAVLSSASIMFLISCASFFGWVLTIEGAAQQITTFLIRIIGSRISFLLFTNLAFLVAGMFVDSSTILLLMIPLIAPVATAYDVSLLHLGVIAGINLSLGTITPPFGASLFVATSIDKNIKIESMYREVLPFCIAGIIGILIITFVPAISSWAF